MSNWKHLHRRFLDFNLSLFPIELAKMGRKYICHLLRVWSKFVSNNTCPTEREGNSWGIKLHVDLSSFSCFEKKHSIRQSKASDSRHWQQKASPSHPLSPPRKLVCLRITIAPIALFALLPPHRVCPLSVWTARHQQRQRLALPKWVNGIDIPSCAPSFRLFPHLVWFRQWLPTI